MKARPATKSPDHAYIEQHSKVSRTARICAKNGCTWQGLPQQQGACYSAEPEIVDLDKLDAQEAALRVDLRELKKRTGKRYVAALEAHYITAMLNWTVTLDEVIQLRVEQALAKLKKQRR